MKSDRSKRRYREKIYELLLGLCVVVLVSFAFPRLSWIGPLGYGLIALLLERHPQASAQAVLDAVISSAHDLGPKGFDVKFGAGRADASPIPGRDVRRCGRPNAGRRMERPG